MSHQTVKFYDNQCPQYKWVTGVATDVATYSNLEVTLRQFAFNTVTNNLFYHCEINICVKDATSTAADDDASDCVPAASLSVCPTFPSFTPTGRRRRAIISSKRLTRETTDSADGDSTTLTLNMNNCAETETIDGIITCTKFAQNSAQSAQNSAQNAVLSVHTFVLIFALL